jgi:hypothetical protein
MVLASASLGKRPRPPRRSSVTLGQLVVDAVTRGEREVNDEAFLQYLFNATAEMPAYVLSGLLELGVTEHPELLGRSITVFPGGTFPRACMERRSLESIFPTRAPSFAKNRVGDRRGLEQALSLPSVFPPSLREGWGTRSSSL